MRLLSSKIFSPKVFRDIDEPMICGNYVVFIQNSCSGSKITIRNIWTGKGKSITMRGILCFNIHTDNKNVVYEFSGSKRGIGVLYVDKFEIKEIEKIDSDIILGGIWDNIIVLKRGYEIVLYDISKDTQRTLISSHHILGSPVVGGGNIAWFQLCKDKCYITLCNIEKNSSLTFMPYGCVNRMYLLKGYVIYQSCYDNRCFIYTYDISSGKVMKCFESSNWTELYAGKDNVVAWTVRKKEQGQYVFDIWFYDVTEEKLRRLISDYKNTIIPTASKDMIIWVEASMDGDDLYLMHLNLQ